MRRLVVVDRTGTIVATAPHPDDVADGNGRFGFLPLEGHTVHELELPDGIETIEHIQELHRTHRVSVDGSIVRWTRS